jgi:3-oxoacyl-[acyl-carrier-protein] synthase-3
LWELLFVPGGASEKPYGPDFSARDNTIHMRGNELFKVAVKSMARACRDALEEAGCAAGDVDLVIPHQANLRIIQALAGLMKVPMEKVYINIDRYGNTSAGTIPLALDEAVREGRVRSGSLVLLPVFGGGLTWGAVLLRW